MLVFSLISVLYAQELDPSAVRVEGGAVGDWLSSISAIQESNGDLSGTSSPALTLYAGGLGRNTPLLPWISDSTEVQTQTTAVEPPNQESDSSDKDRYSSAGLIVGVNQEFSPKLMGQVGLSGGWGLGESTSSDWNFLSPSAGLALRLLSLGEAELSLPISAEIVRWKWTDEKDKEETSRVLALGGGIGVGMQFPIEDEIGIWGAIRYHPSVALVDRFEDEPEALAEVEKFEERSMGALTIELTFSATSRQNTALAQDASTPSWLADLNLSEDEELVDACVNESWDLGEEGPGLIRICRDESGDWLGVGRADASGFVVIDPVIEALAALWKHFQGLGAPEQALHDGLIPAEGALRDAWQPQGSELRIEGVSHKTNAGESLFVSRDSYQVGSTKYRIVGLKGSLTGGQELTFFLRD